MVNSSDTPWATDNKCHQCGHTKSRYDDFTIEGNSAKWQRFCHYCRNSSASRPGPCPHKHQCSHPTCIGQPLQYTASQPRTLHRMRSTMSLAGHEMGQVLGRTFGSVRGKSKLMMSSGNPDENASSKQKHGKLDIRNIFRPLRRRPSVSDSLDQTVKSPRRWQEQQRMLHLPQRVRLFKLRSYRLLLSTSRDLSKVPTPRALLLSHPLETSRNLILNQPRMTLVTELFSTRQK